METEDAPQIKELIKTLDETMVEEVINNNEVIFEIDGTKYRVRKPTFQEKQEVFKRRAKKYIELLRDDAFMLEVDLRKLYKKRGVDLDEMDTQFSDLEKEKEDLLETLGKALKEKISDDKVKTLKEEIERLGTAQGTISLKKVELLQYSIETQVMLYIYAYLTYLVSEKANAEGRWIKVFETYQKFEESSGNIVNRLVATASLLIRHELELS